MMKAQEMNTGYDLIIVGGGSAAFAAALKVSERGGRAVIINEGLPIGGTCVNTGCVPSKALIRAAEVAHCVRHDGFEGITTSAEVADFSAVTGQVQSLVRELRREKYLDVIEGEANVDRIEGRAHVAGARAVEVNGRRISGKAILVATGARPAAPDIPGLEEAGYLTNVELYKLEERPDHLLVLGGGYIALENAQAFARLGSRVTVLELLPRVLATEAEDITRALTGYLQAEGVDIHTEVETTSVRREDDTIVLEAAVGGERRTFRGSHLFVATGRRGNTEDLDLHALGIEIGRGGYLQVNETLRTSVPTIFGAGDVLGRQQFVYTAAYEGALAAENALKEEHKERDYTALPWVVFTDPQVAGVGLDERGAQAAGIDFDTATLPLSQVPRALAARDTRGFIKLIRDRETDRLVGARILAPEGSELLMEPVLAIRYGIPVKELAAQFHPYLTLSEGIKLAALAFHKDVRKLSCCAG